MGRGRLRHQCVIGRQSDTCGCTRPAARGVPAAAGALSHTAAHGHDAASGPPESGCVSGTRATVALSHPVVLGRTRAVGRACLSGPGESYPSAHVLVRPQSQLHGREGSSDRYAPPSCHAHSCDDSVSSTSSRPWVGACAPRRSGQAKLVYRHAIYHAASLRPDCTFAEKCNPTRNAIPMQSLPRTSRRHRDPFTASAQANAF